MAQSPEEIAKDMMVAWLSHNAFTYNSADKAKDLGEKIGDMYKAVLQAVQDGKTGARASKVSGV